ncbi:flagellar assembly protein FliH [Alteromonas confluentis]|uniref:Flagellar assembly protein FliH n=1 Tax=Alteromonas confluentis TaxID=1656094 RepID=A0A1E7Z602_9ALTE|nr:flagellar assembly protein FliH [Alteromonas confluentis]OFC68930.1 flagellar assembly protein FliH [Alteromonas confluentis]
MNDKLPKNDEFSDAKSWDLPFLDEAQTTEDLTRTNALNRRSDWKYEPPEAEEEEILPPTAEEIEAIRQSAYDEGYNEGKQTGFDEGKAAGFEEGKTEGYEAGLQAGKEDGLNAAEEEMAALGGHWSSLADNLVAPLSQVNEDTRKQLVKLAVSLARAVIRTEVQTSEDVVMQALAEGLKALPVAESQFHISMHPDDIRVVKNHYGDETIAAKGWHFIEAPAMSRGGCDITTQQNAVDVSVERRCRDVLNRFLLDQGLSDD